jgi:two-component system, OmpR family, sensor histidine kinase KdpD
MLCFAYARSRNVSKIVGKQQAPLWNRLLRGSVLDDLIEVSGDIEIYAISGEPEPQLRVTSTKGGSGQRNSSQYLFAGAVIVTSTIVSMALRSTLNPVNLVMFYLLGIVAIAMRAGRAAKHLWLASSAWRRSIFYCLIRLSLCPTTSTCSHSPSCW